MAAKVKRAAHPLEAILARHKDGSGEGAYAICSANPYVLEAAMNQARRDGRHVLIEATSNQVNQYGGYTGMTPGAFMAYVLEMADAAGFPRARLVCGGDHLGPNPWQAEPHEKAMARARQLVQDFVRAGFTKIHLDASMRCRDDPGGDGPLDGEIIAGRAADLCAACESAVDAAAAGAPPLYVIGTEVPPPGGARERLAGVAVTRVEDAARTIAQNREAFRRRGLDRAWERVIAVVVQPGVEFGNDSIQEYDRAGAGDLSSFIATVPGLVYEAHSTDYQTRFALRQMVEDHFAVLKVGPWLTFAFREGVFGLADMEQAWLETRRGIVLSGFRRVLDEVMVAEPAHWINHCRGDETQVAFARRYGFSDRSRYYWPDRRVQASLKRLLANLAENPVPLTLLSQHLPGQYQAVREKRLRNRPHDLLVDKVMEVTAHYAYAC